MEVTPAVTAAEGLEITAHGDVEEGEALLTQDIIEDTDMADIIRPETNIDKVKDVQHMEAGPEETPAEGLESTTTVPGLDTNETLTTIEQVEDNSFGEAHRPEANVDKVVEKEFMEIPIGQSAPEGIESTLNVPEVETGEALGAVDSFYDSDKYDASRPAANIDKVKEIEQMEAAPGETPAEHMEPVEEVSEPNTAEVLETIGSVEDTVTAASHRPDTSVDKVQEVNYMESTHHETIEDREITTEVPELDAKEVFTSVGLSEHNVSDGRHRPATNIDKVGEIIYMESTPAETLPEEQETTGDVSVPETREVFTSVGLSEHSVSEKAPRPAANIDKVAEDIHLEVTPGETAPEEQETVGEVSELQTREGFTSVGLSEHSVSEKADRPAANIDKVGEVIQMEVTPAESAPEEQETVGDVAELITKEVFTSVGLSENSVSEKADRPGQNIDKVGEVIQMEVTPAESAPEEQETVGDVAELGTKEALTSVGLSEHNVSEKADRPAQSIDKVAEAIHMEASPGETAPEEQEATGDVPQYDTRETFASVGQSPHSHPEKTERPVENIDKVTEIEYTETTPAETAKEEQEALSEVPQLDTKEVLTSVGISEKSASIKTQRPTENVDKVREIIDMETSPHESAPEGLEATSKTEVEYDQPLTTVETVEDFEHGSTTLRAPTNIDQQKKLEQTFTAFEERGPSPDLIYEDIPTQKESSNVLSLQSVILDTFAKQQQEVETQEQVYPEQPVGGIEAEVPEEQAGESQLPVPAPVKYDTAVLPTETEELKKLQPNTAADELTCPSPDLIYEDIPGLREDDIIKTQQEVRILEPFGRSQQEVETQEQIRPEELIGGIEDQPDEGASESQLPAPEPQKYTKDVLPTETLEHQKFEFTITGYEQKCASPDLIYESVPAFTAMETLKTWQDAMVIEPFAKDQQIVETKEQVRPTESLHDLTAQEDGNASETQLPVPQPEIYRTDVLPTESREENKLEMTFVPDELSCPSPDYVTEVIPLMKDTETVQSEQEVILVEPVGRSQMVVETKEQVRPHESLHDLTDEAPDEEADMSQLRIPSPETFAVDITPMVTSEQVRPDEYLADISADESEGEADVLDLPVPAPETIAIDVMPTVSLEQTRQHESIGDIPAEVSDEEALVSEREAPEEEDLGVEMTLCAVDIQVRPDELLSQISAEASDEEAQVSALAIPEPEDLGVEMTMCTVDMQVRPDELLSQISAEASDEEAQVSELAIPEPEDLGVEMTMCTVDMQVRPDEALAHIEAEVSDEEAYISELEYPEEEELGVEMTMSVVNMQVHPDEILTDIEADVSDEEADMSEMEWLEGEELGVEMTVSTVDIQVREEEMLAQIEADIDEEEASVMMIPIPDEEGFYVALIPAGAKEQMRPDEVIGMIEAELDEEEAWVSERETLEEEDFEISLTLSGVKEQLGREEIIADVPETISPDLAHVEEMPAVEAELEVEMTMSKTNVQVRSDEEQLSSISPERDEEEGMLLEEEMFDSESDWIEVKRTATNAREQKKRKTVEAVFHEDIPEELGTEVTEGYELSQPLISKDEKVVIATAKKTQASLANLQKTPSAEEEERLSSPDFLESEMIIERDLPKLELKISEPEIKTLEMTTLVIPAKEKLEVKLRQELEEEEIVKPYYTTTRKELFQMMKDLGPQERYRMEMRGMLVRQGRMEVTWQPENVSLQAVSEDEDDFVKVKRKMVDSSIQVDRQRKVTKGLRRRYTHTDTERSLMMAQRDEAYIENYQSSMFIPKKENKEKHTSTFVYKKEKQQPMMHSSALVMRTKKTAELTALKKQAAQHSSSLVVQKIKEQPKSHTSTVVVKREAARRVVQTDLRRQATHTNTLKIKGRRPPIQFDTGTVIENRRTERIMQARQDMLAVFERQQQTARHSNSLYIQQQPKLPMQTFVLQRTQQQQQRGQAMTLAEIRRMERERRMMEIRRQYREEQESHSTTYIVEPRKPQKMSIFTQYMDQQQQAYDWRQSHLSVYDRMVRPPAHYSSSLHVQRAAPMRMLEIPIQIQVLSLGGRARTETRSFESSWESRLTTRREVRSRSHDRYGPVPMNYGTTLIIEIHTYPTYSPAYIHTIDLRDRSHQTLQTEDRNYQELMIQSSQSALLTLQRRRGMRELTPTTRQNIMMIQSGQTKVIPIVITVYITHENWRSSQTSVTTRTSSSYETTTRTTSGTTSATSSDSTRPVLRTYTTSLYVECPKVPTLRPTITIEIHRTTPGLAVYGAEFQRYAVTKDHLQVVSPPNFPDPIEPQVVMHHGAAVFIGYITGSPQPDIRWYWRKRLVKPGGRVRTYYERDTGRVELVIMDVRAEDFGEVTCVAVNPGGRATCSANLIVVKKYFAKD